MASRIKPQAASSAVTKSAGYLGSLYKKARLKLDPVKSRRKDFYLHLQQFESARQEITETAEFMDQHMDWAREKHWSMNAFGYGAFQAIAAPKLLEGFDQRQKEWEHQEEMEDYWGEDFYKVMTAGE